MVKDIPIPKEIFQEFQPLVENKKSLAKLFDDFDFDVLGNKLNIGKEMPSHSKGQNCLDKYFAKVNLKDSENRSEEMGKKNTKFNTIHEMSNSSGSETEMTSTLKTIPQTNPVYEPKDLDDLNCKENIEFERLPSKPIIAAMNALGKLKRGISELNVDDNSSRDSTALVIDEEQLESEKDATTISPEEPFQSKQSSKKSLNNNDLTPLKDTASLSGKPTLSGSNKNESLTISQFFNTSKTTSTPVDGSKGTKRKRSGSSSEHPHSKKSKEKNLGKDSECFSETYNENMENLTEVNPLRDGSCPLILEDLDSEDEIYVVQCPKEVELESLVGKQIELNGESTLKLQADGEVRPFDCFSQKDSMERHVNIILPSKDDGAFKFGIYQLNGSVVISESLDAQHITSDDEERLKEVTSEDSENKPTEQPNELQLSDSQKRKKPKKRNIQSTDDMEEGGITSPKGESPDENNMSCTIKKKKKKKDKIEGKMYDHEENLDFGKSTKKIRKEKEEEELPFVHQQEEFTGDEKPIKKKKKKKHLDEPEKVEKEMEMDNKIPLENKNEELLAVQEDNPTKKKKKKKYKEREDESEHISMEPVPESFVTDDQPVKKKKKKKYQEQEFVPPIEIEDDTSPRKKHKHQAEEFVPPIEIEDDTSPRKKHKHQAEDSTDLYLRTGEVGDVDTPSHLKLSTFIETDAQSIKKKKKKKKKKERDISSN